MGDALNAWGKASPTGWAPAGNEWVYSRPFCLSDGCRLAALPPSGMMRGLGKVQSILVRPPVRLADHAGAPVPAARRLAGRRRTRARHSQR